MSNAHPRYCTATCVFDRESASSTIVNSAMTSAYVINILCVALSISDSHSRYAWRINCGCLARVVKGDLKREPTVRIWRAIIESCSDCESLGSTM